MMRTGPFFSLIPVISLIFTSPASAQIQDASNLLEKIREKSGLPALAGAVVIGDDIRAVGATGFRKSGDKTPVEQGDKFHIGSCTKPMTATLAAILVEEGKIRWDSTVGEVLAKRIGRLHPDFAGVTLEQLLAHTGGFPKQAPRNAWKKAWANQGVMPAEKQRIEFATELLKAVPEYQPGTKTEYSNQGYAVAGVMLETVTGETWENLMRDRIFAPLEMKSAGFRAPASPDQLDQPWGHGARSTPVAPEPSGDNPDAIGPAGTVHVSMEDWAKFARFHLNQKTDSLLKKKESFEKLNATLPNSGKHGVGGWVVHDIDRLGGHCIQMTGSNTMWFCIFWLFPADDMAIVVATNAAPESAFGTCDEAVVALKKEFGK